MQKAFHIHFKLNHCDAVLDRKTILLWVQKFLPTQSVLKQKPPGRLKYVQTPENVSTVRQSIMQSLEHLSP